MLIRLERTSGKIENYEVSMVTIGVDEVRLHLRNEDKLLIPRPNIKDISITDEVKPGNLDFLRAAYKNKHSWKIGSVIEDPSPYMDFLCLLDRPSSDAEIIETIPGGALVFITEDCINKQDDDYLSVVYNDKCGYVVRQWIKTV